MTQKPGAMSPDRKTDEAVIETFPASDPVAITATRGARAVPVDQLTEDAAPPRIPDSVTLRRSFDDAESAKLALETLVRDAPVDRRHAEIANDNDATGFELRLTIAANDATRVQDLLDRA